MIETSYTIEQFESDFENAANLENKHVVLTNALNIFDDNDPIIKEYLLKHKTDLIDLKSELSKEEDIKCNIDIDNDLVELYTCIKEIPSGSCKVGSRYYIKVDNLSVLDGRWSEVATDEMREFISKMKPIIWIYLDNGIGTLKYREILKDELTDYFEK